MFFTAMAYSDNRKAAMEAGANEYLVKPNDFEKLPQTVDKLLSAKAHEYENESANEANVSNGIY
jgi:DNA-binding response OmpR family regulator